MDRKTCPVCLGALDLHSDAEVISCARALVSRTRAEKLGRAAQAPAH